MIRFLSNNLIEGALITPSTENLQFPATNIQHDFRTKVFRSTTNSDSVVFDIGSTEPVDYFGIVDNWQSGFGVSTITLEANSTDEWSSPAFSLAVTFDTAFGVGITSFAEQNYRFWRVVMTSTLGYCELANIFIGKAVNIDTNGISYNWAYANKDNMKKATTRYGQEFIDDVNQRKELTGLKIRVMNTTELDSFFEVYDNRRTVSPMFIEFCDPSSTISNNNNRFNGMYKFTSTPKTPNFSAGFWNTSFSLKEQK